MIELPTGSVTFLFTDIEGSTQLFGRFPEVYRDAVRRHHDLLERAVQAHNGVVFETVGDAVYAAFGAAHDAVLAALDGHVALLHEPWGAVGEVRVRIGIHCGAVELQGRHYFGLPLYRCARLMATAHGGQTVLSAAVAAQVAPLLPADVALRDLGEHRLKDFTDPERILQVSRPPLPAAFPPLRAADYRPTNLPAPATAFVGRARLVEDVCRLLLDDATRWVTLLGPGGAGKTRLALRAGADLLAAGAFAGGLWFVPLAEVRDPAAVPAAIAQALGVRETAAIPLDEALAARLRGDGRPTLLIADNCEQVDGAAAVLARLAAACPQLTILATSRVRLRVSGEHAHAVPPLELPGLAAIVAPEEVAQVEAVRLFVDRAREANPSFALTAENAAAVAEICRRLDGLPLAIELAAARARILSPQAMAAHLGRRLALVTGGAPDLPLRQQSLRSAIDWSYDLLTPAQQTVFRRLAVFAGCTATTATAVLAAPATVPAGEPLDALETLDCVGALVGHSLLVADGAPPDASGEPRFRMLETVREYAWERLDRSGERAAIQERHAQSYLDLAQTAAAQLRGPRQIHWLTTLDVEQDNLRAALEWATGGDTPSGRPAIAVELAAALGWYWFVRGRLAEGQAALRAALTCATGQPAPAAACARALLAAGHLAIFRQEYGAARAALAAALAGGTEVQDRHVVGRALTWLGVAAHSEGAQDEAVGYCDRALGIFRELSDDVGIADTLTTLGLVSLARGDEDGGARLCRQSLDVYRTAGDRWGVCDALGTLASIAYARDEPTAAQNQSEEALILARELGDTWGAADALSILGALAARRGDGDVADRLHAEALPLYRQVGDTAGAADALRALGTAARTRGDLVRASALLRECEAHYRDLADAGGLTATLDERSLVAQSQGDDDLAARLADESLALRAEMGARTPGSDALGWGMMAGPGQSVS